MDTLVIDLCSGKRGYGRAFVQGVVSTEAGAILRQDSLKFHDSVCIHGTSRGGELYGGSILVSCDSLPAIVSLGIYYAENRQYVGLDAVSCRNGHTNYARYLFESRLGCSVATMQ